MRYYHNTVENKVYAYDTADVALAESVAYGNVLPEVFTTIAENITNFTEITVEEAEVIANPPPSNEQLAKLARSKRAVLLGSIDTLVSNPFRWDELSVADKQGLSEYRQLLLGIPDQIGFPEVIIWPSVPVLLEEQVL